MSEAGQILEKPILEKADQWFLRARGEGKKLTAKGHEDFSGVMEVMCIFIVVLATCLIHLSKSIKMSEFYCM